MSNQLPATISPRVLTTATDTHPVPVLIVDAGEQAGWRYVDFLPPASATRTHAGTTRAQPLLRLVRGCGTGDDFQTDRMSSSQ
jgi:hypothetical protein